MGASEVAGYGGGDGLTGVGLVVAEAGAGVDFEAPCFSVFLDAEVDAGEGEVEVAGEFAAGVG